MALSDLNMCETCAVNEPVKGSISLLAGKKQRLILRVEVAHGRYINLWGAINYRGIYTCDSLTPHVRVYRNVFM